MHKKGICTPSELILTHYVKCNELQPELLSPSKKENKLICHAICHFDTNFLNSRQKLSNFILIFLSETPSNVKCSIKFRISKRLLQNIYFHSSVEGVDYDRNAPKLRTVFQSTSYLTNSYIFFTLEIESVSKITIFGLKMMVKSGLEKIFLKFLHAEAIFF